MTVVLQLFANACRLLYLYGLDRANKKGIVKKVEGSFSVLPSTCKFLPNNSNLCNFCKNNLFPMLNNVISGGKCDKISTHVWRQ